MTVIVVEIRSSVQLLLQGFMKQLKKDSYTKAVKNKCYGKDCTSDWKCSSDLKTKPEHTAI